MTIGEGIFKGIKDDVLKQNIRNHTNKLIPLKSEKGIFNETNYHEVKTMLTLFENKQTYVKRKFAVNALMTFLKDREMLPAIIFVFSRKQVEVLSQEITTGLLEDDSKIPYTIANECSQVLRSKITNFKEYLELPEYISLVKLLEKGIGIHHSGMIPVLREIVELFISKKYIKLLIATESFAIGLDCPIKTAVFISLTKFDGNQMRLLAPHEYSQMSGRAGRRGIDTIGNIVHCSNLFPLPSITEYRDILCGTPQKLESKFQISYSVLFSLMTVHGGSIDVGGIQEFVEKSMSFREIQSSLQGIQKNMDVLEEKFRKKQEFLKILKTPEEILVQYVLSKKGLEMASHKKRKEITKELSKYVDEHKNLEKDLIVWMEKEDIGVSLNKERTYLRETQNRVKQQIQNIISIMQTYGYVQRTDTVLHLTKLGELACHFSEVHPLLMSNVVYPECSGLTPQQIVGLLSCFTKVKIENTAEETEVKEPALKKIIEKVKQMMDHLERDELAVGLFTYSDNNEIIYHLVDVMMEWCDCLDENACKYFIQTSLVEKGISIGDFTKAVLKIETIVQEIEKTCITESSVDLLHKCSLIHPIILKYITTSQSLYI
jgi:superfamily II RNA helicase